MNICLRALKNVVLLGIHACMHGLAALECTASFCIDVFCIVKKKMMRWKERMAYVRWGGEFGGFFFLVSTRAHVHTTEGEEVGPCYLVSFKVNLI